MSSKALLIIDMLNDFIHEKGTLYCGQESKDIISFIQDRLSTFREQGDPVIFIQDSHAENDTEFERYPPHAVEGTWGNEIIPELNPDFSEAVIPKKTLSSFYGTRLEETLEQGGVKEVEVVGVCTSICIMDAVGELVNRGYKVSVPVKGVADFDPPAHDFALKRMKQVYGANIE